MHGYQWLRPDTDIKRGDGGRDYVVHVGCDGLPCQQQSAPGGARGRLLRSNWRPSPFTKAPGGARKAGNRQSGVELVGYMGNIGSNNMLGFEQPKPTFLNAWISSLPIAIPSALIAIYGFHTAVLGTVLVVFVGSIIMASSFLVDPQ